MRQFAPALALLFCASLAQGQEPRLRPAAARPAGASAPVTITADRMEGYANKETSASGNAELRQDKVSIHADRLLYLYATDEVQASGGVRLARDGDRMSGTGLRLRVHDNVGQFDQADYEFSLRSRAGYAPVRARGTADVIKLEGKNKYHLENATFTTCKPGNDDWYLQVGELDLDMTRDLGTARRGKLVFKGAPIVYLPWVDFPLHNQRKSGFLPPTIGSTGKSGVEISTPFYLNLAPDRDLTIAPREFSKRGLQLTAQLRYVDRDYEGDARFEHMSNDRVRNLGRFATNIQHNQRFSGKLSGYLNLNKVSDDNYFRDLSSRINITSQTTLPRDGMLTYHGGWWVATARAQRFQTLQDPANPVIPPYDRLPQFTLNATRQYVGGVDLGLNSEFVKFDRGSGFTGVTAVPANTGGVNASEVVGSRLTMYPNISMPLIAPGAYLTPKLGFHSTNYSLARNPVGVADTIQRSLPIASLDSGLTFERDSAFLGQNFRQTLEPRLYYLHAPYRDQSRIPLFDTGLADFNYAQIFSENLFNGGDRIADAHQLTIAATTRILSPASGQEVLKSTIGQRHYFQNQQVALNDLTPTRTDKTSDFLAAVSGRIARNWTLDSALQYNPRRNFFERLGLGARYQPEITKALNLGYRFTRGSLNQVDVSAQWPLGGGWYGVGRYNYSLRDNRLVESLGGFEYNGACWIGRVVVQRFAAATGNFTSAVFVQLELNGFSRIGSNPLETLKRNIPGYGRLDQTRPDSRPFDFYE
ncbi:MAG: LPS-assembly protein LptD [Betaproteobacteria bacterium]|nr:LPS-assembly protein LptD [Betaproteobacteria bacterium]